MLYVIVQMWLWLALAAVIGFAVGWLLRGRFGLDRVDALEDDLVMLRAARDRLEQDNKRLAARVAALDVSAGKPASPGAAGVASPASMVPSTPPPEIEAERPPALPGPRGGVADDLKRISGIGPKLEDVLHQLGIFHYDQIASWTPAQIEWVDGYLRFKGRIVRERWTEQAKMLARGEATEFSKLYDQGNSQKLA